MRFQGAAKKDFAHAGLKGDFRVIDVGGIEVIDAVADGIIEHRLGFGFVNQVGFALENRQAHGAETQDGELLASLASFAIEHVNLSVNV